MMPTNFITFDDSYKADGFQAGVTHINKLLEPMGFSVVAEWKGDEHPYLAFEYVYKVTIQWRFSKKNLRAISDAEANND